MEKPVLRDALGQFATGVCVVTSMVNNKAIGMTINSFSSVSMEPPLILWSIQNNSDCYTAFGEDQLFAINVLNESQQSLSNTMAQKGDHVLAPKDYTLSPHNMALINGALATFECKPWKRYDGGDHTIIVGEVIEHSRQEGKPLLFYSGSYQQLK